MEFSTRIQEGISAAPTNEFRDVRASVHFSRTCFIAHEPDLFALSNCGWESEMAEEIRRWTHQGEAFWRAHHEALEAS